MTIREFFEYLIFPFADKNYIIYDESETIIAEFSFTREQLQNNNKDFDNAVKTFINNFYDYKICNFAVEPHFTFNKSGIMIYHLITEDREN